MTSQRFFHSGCLLFIVYFFHSYFPYNLTGVRVFEFKANSKDITVIFD